MVKITIDLLKKRSEHHDGSLDTLYEIALHQQEIERIEVIGDICKDLGILYLQNNLIGRIENLNRLKKLTYLNLALNNIKKIEGLDGCESLEKLDLTVNFIEGASGLRSVANLKSNIFLTDLYLTGNPIAKLDGYRDYVIAVLPQLEKLDGVEITRADRLSARQRVKEEKEKEEKEEGEGGGDVNDYTPESRTKMYREMASAREEQELARNPPPPKTSFSASDLIPATDIQLNYSQDGRILQKNEGHYEFKWILNEEEGKGGGGGRNVVLDVTVPKFLDSSWIDADVNPTYVRICIKNKAMVLLTPCEVVSSAATAQRSVLSGHLVITMPVVVGECECEGDAANTMGWKVKGKVKEKVGDDLFISASNVRARSGVGSDDDSDGDDSDMPPLE